jgi:hypothetical protein
MWKYRPVRSDLDDTVIIGPVQHAPADHTDVADDDTIILLPDAGHPATRPVPTPAAQPAPASVAEPVADEVPSTSPVSSRIRIGSHEFSLEVPAFIGRAPSTPRITGGKAFRLVRVPSRRREISGTHVSVRQEGRTVVVTSLSPTNGTTVLLPGAEPLTLRRGESMVAFSGSIVDIGDGIRIEIEQGERT